jgi:hypothetical protein
MLSLGAEDALASYYQDYSGNITYHSDVEYLTLTLTSDATDVKIWTDSFNYDWNDPDQHFDPIIALWDQDGNLLGENDDTPNQVHSPYLDGNSYLGFASLGSGTYTISITASDNTANGFLLSDGFKYDSYYLDEGDRITIEDYSGADGYYHVNVSAVPVPSAVFLLGPALLGLLGMRRKLVG